MVLNVILPGDELLEWKLVLPLTKGLYGLTKPYPTQGYLLLTS